MTPGGSEQGITCSPKSIPRSWKEKDKNGNWHWGCRNYSVTSSEKRKTFNFILFELCSRVNPKKSKEKEGPWLGNSVIYSWGAVKQTTDNKRIRMLLIEFQYLDQEITKKEPPSLLVGGEQTPDNVKIKKLIKTNSHFWTTLENSLKKPEMTESKCRALAH